jgi:uncharacterized MAPEG superfamily protein
MLKRCAAAHQNGLEILTLFGPAVAFAVARKVPDAEITRYTSTFLYLRVAYNLIYILGTNPTLSYLRTVIFFSGAGVALQLFAAGARQPSL